MFSTQLSVPIHMFIYTYIPICAHSTPVQKTDHGSGYVRDMKLYFVVQYDGTRSLARYED